MDKIMEKLNKLSLPAVILIASIVLGGFFYTTQVSKQKSIERQQQVKIEQDKQDQIAKELKDKEEKEKAEQALNACIADATSSYSEQWFGECKGQGKLTDRCISLHDMTLEEYAKEKNIPEDQQFTVLVDFYKEKDECSCRLTFTYVDRLDKSLQDAKDECFKKYPQP